MNKEEIIDWGCKGNVIRFYLGENGKHMKVSGAKNYWKSTIQIVRHPITKEKLCEWEVTLRNCKEGYGFEPRMEIKDLTL